MIPQPKVESLHFRWGLLGHHPDLAAVLEAVSVSLAFGSPALARRATSATSAQSIISASPTSWSGAGTRRRTPWTAVPAPPNSSGLRSIRTIGVGRRPWQGGTSVLRRTTAGYPVAVVPLPRAFYNIRCSLFWRIMTSTPTGLIVFLLSQWRDLWRHLRDTSDIEKSLCFR